MTGNGRSPGGDGPLVVALASGHTHAEAADIAGVSERTVRRRVADPEIAADIAEVRAAMVERATARAVETLDAAVGAIADLLESDSETIRLRAAIALVDKAMALRDLDTTERRLRALEQAVTQDAETNHWWPE